MSELKQYSHDEMSHEASSLRLRGRNSDGYVADMLVQLLEESKQLRQAAESVLVFEHKWCRKNPAHPCPDPHCLAAKEARLMLEKISS